MLRRLLMVLSLASAVLVVVPDVALAASAHSNSSSNGSLPLPLAFLGIHFPSVSSIVAGVVKLFFGALLSVLGVPVHGTAAALRWLIAVPDRPIGRSGRRSGGWRATCRRSGWGCCR